MSSSSASGLKKVANKDFYKVVPFFRFEARNMAFYRF
jgi:hypothetical protein